MSSEGCETKGREKVEEKMGLKAFALNKGSFS